MTKEKTPSAELAYLRRLIDNLCLDWSGVMSKRMFGTDAWFVNGNIFAILDTAKESVGVRLSHPEGFKAARALKGASDFAPGEQAMKNWVILPQKLSKKETEFESYLRQAYDSAAALPSKVLKMKGRPLGKAP